MNKEISNIIEQFERKNEIFKNLVENINKKPLIIYSAGIGCEVSIDFLEKNCVQVNGICDNSVNLQGKKYEVEGKELTVTSPRKAVEQFGRDINFFVACDPRNYLSAVSQLTELGVCAENIYQRDIVKSDYFKYPDNFTSLLENYTKKYIIRRKKEIEKVVGYLSDDISKDVYLTILTHLYYSYKGQVSKKYFSEPQYFIDSIFSFSDEEIFVDAGMYHGETTQQFVEFMNSKYKHVYGLEADKKNYAIAKETLKSTPNISVLNYALYSKKTTLRFDEDARPDSRLNDKGKVLVEAISGDDLNIKPTFIKMDVEGAEMDALEGFKNTIVKYKPKLAICIYHSIEDFWRIPLYIKELVPEYKIYIRNHSIYCNEIETVCYATI